MVDRLRKAYDEGFGAFADGLGYEDCPYDSFNQLTENEAMEWINGYRDAEANDHDHAPR